MQEHAEHAHNPDAAPERADESAILTFNLLGDRLAGSEIVSEPGAPSRREAYYQLDDGRLVRVESTNVPDTPPESTSVTVDLAEVGPGVNPWFIKQRYVEQDGHMSKFTGDRSAPEQQQATGGGPHAPADHPSNLDEATNVDAIQQRYDALLGIEREDDLNSTQARADLASANAPAEDDPEDAEADPRFAAFQPRQNVDAFAVEAERDVRRGELVELGTHHGIYEPDGSETVYQHDVREVNEALGSLGPEQRISPDEYRAVLGRGSNLGPRNVS